MTFTFAEYKKAKAEIKPHLPGSSFLKIRFGYDQILILPYKDGIKFIETLDSAEILTSEYSDSRIVPLNTNSLRIEVLSKEEYGRIKLCGILGCTLNELVNAEEEFKKQPA